ncbi:MAG TPA: ATP-binding protein [Bryocella sp.]|nr:ATP-binding protein [Bryocella sp.]
MAVVTVIVTALFLILLHHRLSAQVTSDLSQDLSRSVITFQNLQGERLRALDRENALLSDLPTLKALMTSGDDLTIQDGAIEFWQLSGNDLFALADASGRVIAVYTTNNSSGASLHRALQRLLTSPERHYLVDGRSLYQCSLRPLYFGSEENGTLLGYVFSGISIERTVRQISEPTDVEAAFLSAGDVVTSTLRPSDQAALSNPKLLSATTQKPLRVELGSQRFLAATEDLSPVSSSPLQLVVLKSFDPAERWMKRIDRMVLSTGLLALISGTLLMIALARLLTRPLEELSGSVRAFGMGDSHYHVPRYGPREVRQLSEAFAGMRNEIQQAHQALLESERLATIGRMASSVSHDLRHYLAAVYANAEFLASGRLSEAERNEIFGDIRAAVLGTTDMIESLLILSRTGASTTRVLESMPQLLERAVALFRAHPDAEGVRIVTRVSDSTDGTAVVDGKQIERAIYNLLLNACQAARTGNAEPMVTVTLETRQRSSIISVTDNGPGVPENIRHSMFEPFVSEGKQKGTGLGLTLAQCIAVEHGGEVTLVSSCPGETVFQMQVARDLPQVTTTHDSEPKHRDQVVAHENV